MASLRSDNADFRVPLVSVVITCYNYGKYLAGCIRSVLAQTYRDFEIIVVDDGSTDQTEQVANLFLPHEKIRYIKQENAGQANAKNRGIKESKADFIAFLDADDLWEKDKLEKQILLFSSDSVGVVYSLARYIDGDARNLDFQLTGKHLQPRRGMVVDYLIMDNFVPFSSSVVRRECFECFGAFDESFKMGIDWDLWLRISTKYEFDFIEQPLLIYRIGHSGQMSKNVEERKRCSDKILHDFVKRFPKNIKKCVLRRAWAYTHTNRGAYYADHSLCIALTYYCRAFFQSPFSLEPMVGALMAILKRLIRSMMQYQKGYDYYKWIVKSDLYRYHGKSDKRSLFSCLFCTPGFKYTFLMHTAAYLNNHKVLLPVYVFIRLLLHRYTYRYGISIPYNTQIGAGFYIGHFGDIIINCEAKIGSNCNVNHGVTIGKSYGGKNPGTPTVGDHVYFGPGCKVFGRITIGNHVAIGANCVVNKDVPDNAVVVGIPGKVISYKGSANYIVNTVSSEPLGPKKK